LGPTSTTNTAQLIAHLRDSHESVGQAHPRVETLLRTAFGLTRWRVGGVLGEGTPLVVYTTLFYKKQRKIRAQSGCSNGEYIFTLQKMTLIN
jgi:hypothetical protein